MVERTESIRQDIDATRSSMANKLEQIEGQVRDKVDSTVSQAKRVVDVRQHVSERPWLSLGAAVMAGYLLGLLGGDDRPEPARPRPGEPMRYYAVDGNGRDEERRRAQQPYEGRRHEAPYDQGQHSEARYFAPHSRRSQMSSVVSQIVDPLRSEISLIATAALRSGMRALRESLQDSLPQFEREYQAAQREHEGHEEGFARAVGDTSGAHTSEYPVSAGTTGTTSSTGGYTDDPFRPR